MRSETGRNLIRHEGRTAFESEALPHLDALYGLALRLTGGDEPRSEDLVQDAMVFVNEGQGALAERARRIAAASTFKIASTSQSVSSRRRSRCEFRVGRIWRSPPSSPATISPTVSSSRMPSGTGWEKRPPRPIR